MDGMRMERTVMEWSPLLVGCFDIDCVKKISFSFSFL